MLRIKEQYDMLEEQRRQLESSLRLNEQFARVTAQHLEELELLHDVGLRLMNNLDLDSVLTVIAQVALELVPDSNRCIMHLLSENQHDLLPVVFSSANNSKIVYPQVGYEPIVREVIVQREAIYIPDLTASPDQADLLFDDLYSLLIVPLIDEQQLIGTLSVLGPEADLFEENQQHVLSILANQAMVAIMKARFFEERQRAKEREKYQIRHLFNRYVNSTVVDRLVEQGDQVALGGKRQEITVLFTDIRSFTKLSENLHPEQLVEVLNQYLALAVNAILEQEGTLDKFMGDAVMAFFNAPLSQPDHVLRGVRAAYAMQQLIKQHNLQLTADDHQVSFGTGLHLGPAVVGNIGTVQQMNYTAIGDTVNLAKRLQENAIGGQIIISEDIYERVKDYVTVNDLGTIHVKGRNAAVHIYELLQVI
jgi:class 3 adenylate cyclase